jgi:hypothetical protein
MRFLAIMIILGALLMPVSAQQNFRPTGKKAGGKAAAEPPTNCTTAAHAHRFDDMRLALVEVTSDDTCGFSYINVENNTTGPDNHFQYVESFIVARAPDYKPNAPSISSDVLTRKAIHQGTRGIAIYCNVCKAVMLLKVTRE